MGWSWALLCSAVCARLGVDRPMTGSTHDLIIKHKHRKRFVLRQRRERGKRGEETTCAAQNVIAVQNVAE
jgi:hypothetical protein